MTCPKCESEWDTYKGQKHVCALCEYSKRYRND
jgi:hypothetical protein